MNRGYRIWFTTRTDSEIAIAVSPKVLQEAYKKITRHWIQVETGFSAHNTPAEFYSRREGGFAMVLKEDLPGKSVPKYRLPIEQRPATTALFVSDSSDILEAIVLIEAGLPYDGTKVQVDGRMPETQPAQ